MHDSDPAGHPKKEGAARLTGRPHRSLASRALRSENSLDAPSFALPAQEAKQAEA